jgi:[ribosomal protein S5]-alanine N-acetyltransferase
MSDTEILTKHLRLVLQTPEQLLAWIEAMSPADRAEVSPEWLARVSAASRADPWTHGFAILERASGACVGNCGYKGPPDADGVVEIAYAVDPAHQSQGFATEAAEALVGYAFDSDRIRLVRAHTLPEANASTRVLTKCGFERVGEVVDPDDGMVWRWEIRAKAEGRKGKGGG